MSITQSLAHGLEILFLFDTSTPLHTVTEISKRLGYTQSKTYRLVRTLMRYGLIQEDDGTARYSLGLSALRLGLVAQQKLNIAVIARPYMKELSQITKETVLLAVVNGTKGVVIERIESEEPVRYSLFQSGVSIPLHAGASSKILMAFLPEEEWDHIIKVEGLKYFTPNTITNANKLKANLRAIREKGYAFSDQEADRHVRAISAPIFNGVGEIMAGLSVAGPIYRISKRKLNELSKLVLDYSQKISAQLGYSVEKRKEYSRSNQDDRDEKRGKKISRGYKKERRKL